MKKIFLLFVNLFGWSLLLNAQFIDTSILSYDLMPEATTETREAAYKAPASKLVGIWYTTDGYSYFDIKPDGSGNFVTLKDSYNGINIVWQQGFRWKKENGLFRVKFIGEAKHTLYEKDQAKYQKLSTPEKEDLMRYFRSLDQNTRDSKPVEDKILYLSPDNMLLEEGYSAWWLVNKKYLERLKKEANQPTVKKQEEVKQDTIVRVVPAQVEVATETPAKETAAVADQDKGEVFVAVEEPAQFPGGQAALMSWLSQNIHYPEAAQQNDIQGRVVVKFIVEKDGSITNPEIARGVDSDLDREAIRVVSKMPKWIPGKNGGLTVRSYYNLPVTFKLSSK